MTIRKLLVLTAASFLTVAAISQAAIDWFGLADFSVREDAAAWGWLGVAVFALSTYPAPLLDRRYGG